MTRSRSPRAFSSANARPGKPLTQFCFTASSIDFNAREFLPFRRSKEFRAGRRPRLSGGAGFACPGPFGPCPGPARGVLTRIQMIFAAESLPLLNQQQVKSTVRRPIRSHV